MSNITSAGTLSPPNGNGHHSGVDLKEAKIAACVREILRLTGDDPDREDLRKTPERHAKALLSMTSGYSQTPRDVVNGAIFSVDTDELVITRDIDVASLCEHHILPFIGKAHIAYIPAGRVLGLSKFPKIVDIFACRFQVQERLTFEIAGAIEKEVKPRGVLVVLECSHMCMCMRGVKKTGAVTITTSARGCLKDDQAARQEVYTLFGLKK